MKKRITLLLTSVVCFVCILFAAACTSPLKDKELTLTVGQIYVLEANVKESDADDIDWETSDKSVVSIKKEGASVTLTAKSVGTATITLYKGDDEIGHCDVTVEPSPLEINLPLGKLIIKKNVTASVLAFFDGEMQGEPVWTTSDPSIGTVEAQGLLARVTAVDRGECVITVSVDGYSASFRLTVGVQ